MRATAISMFLSAPRCTASWIVRSTRGPGVVNGMRCPAAGCGTGWTCRSACWTSSRTCAGSMSVSLCFCAKTGVAATSATTRPATAVPSTFFLTRPSTNKCISSMMSRWKLRPAIRRRHRSAAGIFAPVVHRLQLDTLLGRQQAIHAIEHQDARLVGFRARTLDLVDVGHHGGFVRGVANHLRHRLLELVEPFAKLLQSRKRGVPDLLDRGRLLIRDAELGAFGFINPPPRRTAVLAARFQPAGLLCIDRLGGMFTRIRRSGDCGNHKEGREGPRELA